MMFFSHKIKFKKQSESLGLNLNDKYIKKSKQQLISLTQKHQEVDESLKKKKIDFENQKHKLISDHQFLIKQEKRHKLKIIKLEVRKDQLMAKKNPSIAHQKSQILKKYLKSMIYTIGDRYEIIKSLGNCSTYEFIKTRILNLEQKIYFKQKMKEVVFIKKLDFQGQQIMFIIKEQQSIITKTGLQNQAGSNKSKTVKSIFNPSKFNPVSDGQLTMKRSYEIKMFAVSGKKFEFTKVYSERQLSSFIEKLSDQKKSLNFDTSKTLSGPLNENRKQRLSLQFNSVFKKSLEGFFFKRASLTTNELQNKLVNIEEWLKQSKNSEHSNADSDHSKTQQDRSICGSSQDRQENLSALSKGSRVSRITEITKNKDKIISRKNQSKNSEQSRQKQKKHAGGNKDLFTNFRSQSQNQLIKINPIIKGSDLNNVSSNNEESQNSNNNTSKPSSELTFNGFVRSFIYGEKILFPDFNPILNIVILKSKKTFQFLPEYFEKKDNFNRINLCVKKYQLKIQLQKQVRNNLLYKIVKLDNFFETQNKSMEPFSVEVLFSVKYAKNDIYIPKIEEIKQNMKLGRQIPIHAYVKGRHTQGFEFAGNEIKGFNFDDIVISCQNIRCQQKQKTFLIHHILKEQIQIDMNNRMFHMLNGINSINTRIKCRSPNIEVRKKKNELYIEELQKSREQRRKNRKNKQSKAVVNKNEELKEEQQKKLLFFREEIHSLFENFVQDNLLSIKEYRFMKKINFEENMQKIIMIQKNMKCSYYRKKYKKMIKNPCIFKFEASTKILITAIHDTQFQQIKIFTECLLLRLNQKYKSYPIVYPEKYWTTISSALTNLMRLSDSIVEIKDELEKYLQKKVKIHEQEQMRLQALKPELYLNRLRRFFINIMLRVKAKRNIIYLKKLYQNSEAYILIIRKSPILKNVCQANLYHLEDFIQKQQNKENLNQIENEGGYADQIEERTRKSIKNLNEKNCSKKHKSRYQTINLLVDYFSNIPKNKISDEFYFDTQNFLLKPFKSPSIYYIERILMIDINSQEIAKEVAMIEWQQPSKKKKNHDQNSFLNLDVVDRNNIIQASIRSSGIGQNVKKTEPNQNNHFRISRKNASILIPSQAQVLQNRQQQSSNKDKQSKQRKSFRISQKSNCKLFEDKSRRSRLNSKLQLARQQRPSIMGQQSINKLSSGNRLSRSSLYDIFNNSYNNKKTQYEITGNGHGKILYYSLAKVQEIFYELHIYMVKRKFIVRKCSNEVFFQALEKQKLARDQNEPSKKVERKKNALINKISYDLQEETVVSDELNYLKKNAFTDELFLVHKENLTKMELLQANWTFIYNKIARWIKNNQHLLVLVQENPNKF